MEAPLLPRSLPSLPFVLSLPSVGYSVKELVGRSRKSSGESVKLQTISHVSIFESPLPPKLAMSGRSKNPRARQRKLQWPCLHKKFPSTWANITLKSKFDNIWMVRSM